MPPAYKQKKSPVEHEAALARERQRVCNNSNNNKSTTTTISLVEHEAALARERHRYAVMHEGLSAEIHRLEKQLATTKSKVQQLREELRPHKRHKIAPTENKHEIKWNMRFKELQAFKEIHGHCNVQRNKSNNNAASSEKYKDLAQWVSTQRTQYKLMCQGKPTCMTPERIQQLKSIGFQWSLSKTPALSWNERFQQLQEFKETHGHSRVPQLLEHPAGLGNWVLEQRRMYRWASGTLKRPPNARSTLTKERIDMLEAIGFEWSLRNRGSSKKSVEAKSEDEDDSFVEAASGDS